MVEEHIVAMKAAEDERMRREMPSVVPPGYEGKKFSMPRFPNDLFVVMKPDGSYTEPFRAEEFVVDPETNIASAHDARTGMPIVVRVLRQSGTEAICVDDAGEQTMLHFEVMPDNTIPIQEPDMGQARTGGSM